MSLNAAIGELPQMCASMYASTASDPFASFASPVIRDYAEQAALRNVGGIQGILGALPIKRSETETMTNLTRRIVQVFIADPNENVPLESSVLYSGEQKLTDLTDSELFFEAPIVEKLKAHNEKRVTWLDKEASKRAGKDVLLDAARIRDLKMVVVTIAQF